MSRFEERLWSELVRDHGAELAAGASAPGDAVPGRTDRGYADRWPVPRRRARSPRALRLLAGAVVVGALAAAGAAIFGPTGNPKDITQFECGVGGHGNIRALLTAEPVAACAALWPVIYHRSAPPLVAWVHETGGAVAVRPATAPPTGSGWTRLPQGWTADGATIELNDQLEDVTTGLPSRPCWSATAAAALVNSILRADGLHRWHVRLSFQGPASSRGASCLTVVQVLSGAEVAPATVLLVGYATTAPAKGFARYPNRFARRRRAVERRVNRMLRSGGGCASLAQAVALWRTDARAGGIPAREDVLSGPVSTAGAAGACARIFVSEPGGGGPANVIAANYP